MVGGNLSGFSSARIDDNDVWITLIPGEALVEDGMGDGEVGADEDDNVGLLEVGICVRWGIEAEGLRLSHDGGRHALSGVAIAVFDAHPEFRESSEEGHFLGRDLAGRDEGDGILAVLGLDFLELRGESLRGFFPGDFFALEERGGGAGASRARSRWAGGEAQR
ncbi:MAG: hypothetical protein ACJAVK_002275 [Akkermansiaceae bacterium]|jgi:hypothetical protein